MSLKDKIKLKIEKRFYNKEKEKWEVKAEEYLNDEEKLRQLIKQAALKVEANKKGPIVKFLDNISLLISLLKDYIKGEYKNIPYGSIIILTASILYFVVPTDIIPDFIVSLGFIDDAVIIGIVLKQIDADLEKYIQWKIERKVK